MASNTRLVPKSALMFAADFQAGDEAPVQVDGTTLYPFAMLARTNGIATHPFWGRCIHDFAGMVQPKPSVTVDYCHSQTEVIGFADQITVTPEGLRMAGALVSIAPGDRAAEIPAKRKAGVPYEASILTCWDGLVVEDVPEGYQADVNGLTVDGPVTIFRQWEIWGVAILPYGSDTGSELQFSAGLSGDVHVTVKGPSMTKPAPTPPGSEKTGQDFINAFGPKGAVWFVEGKSFAEAAQKFGEDLQQDSEAKDEKITELEGKIGELEGELEKTKAEYEAELEKSKAEYEGQVDELKKEFAGFTGGKPVSSPPPAGPGSAAKPLVLTDNVSKFAGHIAQKMPKSE